MIVTGFLYAHLVVVLLVKRLVAVVVGLTIMLCRRISAARLKESKPLKIRITVTNQSRLKKMYLLPQNVTYQILAAAVQIKREDGKEN